MASLAMQLPVASACHQAKEACLILLADFFSRSFSYILKYLD
jgi:hypothetical protein